MQNTIPENSLSTKYLIQLHYIYSISLLLLIAFILSAALYLQFVYNEIPCPLCLLQRVAYLGIGFSIMLNLRNNYSLRHDGLMLLVTVILLIISTRQTLLDIYPRPGHEYIGTAILGLHMPVWSIIISVLLFSIYALKFCIFGYIKDLENISLASFPILKFSAVVVMWFIIALCSVNLVSSYIQCGLQSCHTTGYRLLE